MKDTETRKLNMGIAVLAGLNDDSIDAFILANATAVAMRSQLEQNIEAVEDANERQQEFSAGGEAITKEEAKHNLADEADIIAQGVCGLALANNDLVLYNQLNLRAPGIYRLKDEECKDFCNLLLTKANIDPAGLLPYNITGARLLAFPGFITAFETAEGAPQNADNHEHAATLDIAIGLDEMTTTLLWWDHWVGTLRTTNHVFYNAYRASRRILNTGVRHVSLRGVVKDSITNTPLYKAKITVLETGGVSYSGKTGKFRVMSLNPGVFTLTIELPGFTKTTISNVSVIEGKITEVPVTLVKNL